MGIAFTVPFYQDTLLRLKGHDSTSECLYLREDKTPTTQKYAEVHFLQTFLHVQSVPGDFHKVTVWKRKP